MAKAAPRSSGKLALKANRAASADVVQAPAPDPLLAYTGKRDFTQTPEPRGRRAKGRGGRFVVQKHAARRLHYDLRLELDGVLKSWAVTRGPSLVAGEKRLAVHTEDHPLQYLTFEGVIPKGAYGGGTMIVWDRGTWQPEGDAHAGYARGHLAFTLKGQRLGGLWHLVRTRPKDGRGAWLLIKADDAGARSPADPDILGVETTSILSGQTVEDLARNGSVRPDHARRATARTRRATPAPDPAAVPGARKAILPPFVAPCLATLAPKAPVGAGWVYEIKHDGYRLQARVEGRAVSLLTRSGLDWTARFRSIVRALKALNLGAAVLDGEVVVETASGASDFSALQAELKAERDERFVYYAFDLLHLDGHDLRGAPLLERKRLLQALLAEAPAAGPLRYNEHLVADGASLVGHACRLGLEGIIAKRADAPYRSGRGEDWLKVKCAQRESFVIAGYTPSSTGAKAIGSLILGTPEGTGLRHVGRVGTGFAEDIARELWTRLEALRRETPPFAEPLGAQARRQARWVEPHLVAEVEFRAWTAEGALRHAAFRGLRSDLTPADLEPAGRGGGTMAGGDEGAGDEVAGVRLTHPDRILWPEMGLTKAGLAAHYAEIAPWILPHVVDRPLSLVRCPSGREKACFFQKHAWAGLDESVRRIRVGDDEALAIRDVRGLIALVQAGVLEIHPWGATLKRPEQPDRLTFDLDPGEGVDWRAVVAAAVEVRERLRALGHESFVKTTGGNGLHVVVPLKPKAGWEEAKAFAAGLAAAMAEDAPHLYTATLAKRARTGRIFVDYLRNGRGATAVAAYSTRARAGAPVATPLAWAELEQVSGGAHYRVETILGRLDHLRADPWEGFSAAARVLAR